MGECKWSVVVAKCQWHVHNGGVSSAPRWDTPFTTKSMTDTARAAALAELAKRLVELTTAAERRAYPMLDHLTDLIDDLEERE